MRVIDLFAGCGGMSLSFELAGCETLFAVEKDAWAAETYRLNHPGVRIYAEDIAAINIDDAYASVDGSPDGVIGGPPCQGFSLSGARDPKDPRNSLFIYFMAFVRRFRPRFFVMENVPGILSARMKNGSLVRNAIIDEARDAGYNVGPLTLVASDFGVPQTRTRVFFIGLRRDLPFDLNRLAPRPRPGKPVTIREALSDLPDLDAGEGREEMEYDRAPTTAYQIWCRASSDKVRNHVAMKHTARLVARFKNIKFGQSLADAPAEHMQRKRGDAKRISGKVYSQNNTRPWPDLPSPTIPASFQSNFIHPLRDRNFTAREGARLQSFPDRYAFFGKRTTMSWEKNLSQYQQIGNAVPPLLARALALAIDDYFRNIDSIRPRVSAREIQGGLWD